jgi:hypothetical protein
MCHASVADRKCLSSVVNTVSDEPADAKRSGMHIQQVVPHDHWPSGDSRDLAEIRFAPDELAARFGLRFEDDLDDLDWYKLAALHLPDGSQVWLYRYRHDPSPGTAVRADAGADFAKTKEQLKQALDLSEDDLLWVAPAARASASVA